MTIIDYVIIAVVTALFALAMIAYRKKPHCSCGQNAECCGNCAGCRCKCGISANK